MIEKLYPRGQKRMRALALLGPHAEEFVQWLLDEGYPARPIRLRLRQLPRVDALLRQQGAVRLQEVTAEGLLRLAPKDSQDDIYLSAVLRSLARCFSSLGLLAVKPPTPRAELVASYVRNLERVRGLAPTTGHNHAATAEELLDFVGYDGDAACLHRLGARDLDGVIRQLGGRLCRASLQHSIAELRSFLRYLAGRGLVARGLDAQIDTPRLYRGERLPRALPWDVVQAFLAAIDRSKPMGKRDYAMFLLIATYGLRTSEVAGLVLDDIHWRAGQFQVRRPKNRSPILLPLTDAVGGALLDYLRGARPDLPHREVFLRARAPSGTLRPTAVTEAFQGWVRRSGLPITCQGPHCLRHSVAVHLLRQGTSVKTIGDLLGHRSTESTCVYLRLHVEDLREVALDLPQEVQP